MFLLLFACQTKEDSFSKDQIKDVKLQNGDVIYRNGNGFFSDFFRKSSKREQLYSHCGVIDIDKDIVYVIHSEASELTGQGGVRRDPLDIFLENISTWAVYRLDTTQVLRDSIAIVASQYLRAETPFDLDFDITSDNKVYCTELVALAINKGIRSGLIISTNSQEGKSYYSIDDTYLVREMIPVIRRVGSDSR